MGQAELQPRRYTPAEYFALEAQSEGRHEYFDGEIFAMAGTSDSHNLLALNMTVALRTALRGQSCRVYMESLRLAVQEGFHYTYPDVMVNCEPTDRQDRYTKRHPVLIVEVLSPGTQEYDRTTKFKQYQRLPSLRHYVLISQDTWTVEWFQRDEAGRWIYTLLNDPAEVLLVPDLNLRLPLAELYEDTDVAPLRIIPTA